jgi:hypothetical protein
MADNATALASSAPAPAKKRKTVRDWPTAKVTRTLRMVNLCNGAPDVFGTAGGRGASE